MADLTTPVRGRPLHVAIIGPPIGASGGIGSLMSYVLAALDGAADLRLHVLDTRGSFSNPALSIVALGRSSVRLVVLRMTGRVGVAHVNISAHGSSLRKPVLVWLSKLLRIPVVLHLHASSYPEFFEPLPSPIKALLRRSFAAADAVIVLGAYWRDFVTRELGVQPERVIVLANATPGPIHATPKRRDVAAPLRIIFLGRLGERKGVPELIAALASPPLRDAPWTATLAGDGDAAPYQAEAARRGIADKIRFPGWVDADRATALLRSSDVLVLPSRAEGLPMAVLEAMAHAVPVVSTPVGALPEVLTDGVNGLLVPPGDGVALAEALELLATDEEMRTRLAFAARHTWESRFAIQPYVRKLVGCWQLASAHSLAPTRGGC